MLEKQRTHRQRSRLIKLAWIVGFWIVVSLLQFYSSYATLIYFEYEFSNNEPIKFLAGSLITGLSAGLLGGGMLVFYWEDWLRSWSYRKSLWMIFLTYTIIYLIVGLITETYLISSQKGLSPLKPELWAVFGERLAELTIFNNYLYWLLVVIITLVALLVNDKYGPGVFVDFLLGKYFHPRREERIFMFLDLRGSTTIAEKLGENDYFNFLRRVYSDITPAILEHRGEIYQYVGDEVVISWPAHKVDNWNIFVNCYYSIKDILNSNSEYYKNNYNGIIPEFKAGLHYGYVMAGEVGVIKREIAYSGDVLNTTARIQAKCNEFGVNLLLSQKLLDKLQPVAPFYSPKPMGKVALRGKAEELSLYTL